MTTCTRTKVGSVVFTCFLGTIVAANPGDSPAEKLEIRRAENKAAEGLIEAKVEGTGQKVYLYKEPILTHKDLTKALAVKDESGGENYRIEVEFTKEAGEKLAKVTAEHMNKPLAILIKGKVVAAPIVKSKISSRAVISGKFSKDEAEKIARTLRQK